MELPDLNTALVEAYRDLDQTNGAMHQNGTKASTTCHRVMAGFRAKNRDTRIIASRPPTPRPPTSTLPLHNLLYRVLLKPPHRQTTRLTLCLLLSKHPHRPKQYNTLSPRLPINPHRQTEHYNLRPYKPLRKQNLPRGIMKKSARHKLLSPQKQRHVTKRILPNSPN